MYNEVPYDVAAAEGFPVANFRRPLRILLDDWDCSVPQRYPSMVLDDAVRTMVQFGKLNGSIYAIPGGYTLTPDCAAITPDWSAIQTGYNLFALGTYETALMFLRVIPDKFSFRTQGLSESRGSLARYVERMEADVRKLVDGECLFDGFQSYYSWLGGVSGLPVGEILAQFDVQSPLWKATFTRDGMRVA